MAFRIIHSIAATSRFAELMKMLIVLFVNTGRGSPETIGYLCKCSPTHFDRTSRFSSWNSWPLDIILGLLWKSTSRFEPCYLEPSRSKWWQIFPLQFDSAVSPTSRSVYIVSISLGFSSDSFLSALMHKNSCKMNRIILGSTVLKPPEC